MAAQLKLKIYYHNTKLIETNSKLISTDDGFEIGPGKTLQRNHQLAPKRTEISSQKIRQMETSLKRALVEQPPSTSSENNIEGHTSVNGPKTSVNVPKTKTFPAWIYCTRYSDRPSCSGKKRILLGFTKQLNICIALS